MPEQLFLFIQMEFPWALGPPDGRYLLRSHADAEPQHVVVLGTVGARRASGRGARRRIRGVAGAGRDRLRGAAPRHPSPRRCRRRERRSSTRSRSRPSSQAQAWLDDLDPERDARAAVAVLNRLLHSHRIATADPYIHELSPDPGDRRQGRLGRGRTGRLRTLAARARAAARSPHSAGGPRRRRLMKDHAAALRPEERLAELLSTRGAPLLCEDLALRARLDLDQGRLTLAAIELDRALAAALPELRGEGRQDLALRIAELDATAERGRRAGTSRDAREQRRTAEEETVRHALERLEALLRARTATGFTGVR